MPASVLPRCFRARWPSRLGETWRPWLIVGGVGVAGALVPVPAVVGRQARNGCEPSGASLTVIATRTTRIYTANPGTSEYGCLFRVGRPVLLGAIASPDANYQGGVLSFRTAGDLVAFEQWKVSAAQKRFYVNVVNLRTGVVARHVPTGVSPTSKGGSAGIGHLVALGLTSRGAAAWIAKSAYSPGSRYEVYKLDGGAARPSLLDMGYHINRHSLRVSHHAVSWLQGGRRRSAALR